MDESDRIAEDVKAITKAMRVAEKEGLIRLTPHVMTIAHTSLSGVRKLVLGDFEENFESEFSKESLTELVGQIATEYMEHSEKANRMKKHYSNIAGMYTKMAKTVEKGEFDKEGEEGQVDMERFKEYFEQKVEKTLGSVKKRESPSRY